MATTRLAISSPRWPSVAAGQNSITRTYDVLNRLTAESDLIGAITRQIDYDADGNVIRRIDGNGNSSEFDVNTFGDTYETRLAFGEPEAQVLKTGYDNRQKFRTSKEY